jgi:hypothetical protein
MHFGAFLAMLGSWLMVIGLVVAGAVSWIMRRRSGRRSGGGGVGNLDSLDNLDNLA